MVTTVVIEDGDPPIRYSPGQISGASLAAYEATAHEAVANGLTLSYEFVAGLRLMIYNSTILTTGNHCTQPCIL